MLYYDWRAIGCVILIEMTRLRANWFQNTHHQVKAKILERMAEWSEEFSKDPDLGIMEQAYMKLKSQSMAEP